MGEKEVFEGESVRGREGESLRRGRERKREREREEGRERKGEREREGILQGRGREKMREGVWNIMNFCIHRYTDTHSHTHTHTLTLACFSRLLRVSSLLFL